VNEPLGSFGLLGGMTFKVSAIPDLPGYLTAHAGPIDKHDQVGKVSEVSDRLEMCLKLPFALGRDLDDVVFELVGEEEWVRVGSSVFRPLETVPNLDVGTQSVAIVTNDHAEWRRLPSDATFSTTATQGWALFDSALTLIKRDRGDARDEPAAAGTYLLLYGDAGGSIDVAVSG
jgi:hypothetical protein